MLLPLRDRILVKPLERKQSDIIVVVNAEKFNLGEVMAVGPKVDTVRVGERIRFGTDEGYLTFPEWKAANGDTYLVLQEAVKAKASDIHFEPEQNFLRIRYRIDGVLETVRSLHKTYMPGITVRIKVISEMNIAETRAPQDGRISLTLNGRPIDFRVSTHPTVHGENIVLRILDREKSIISLDKMNLPPATLTRLNLMLARPEGIMVVTGPTGSGKTTTLYSLLSQVNDEAVNIMTLEDPVEYPLTLMRQTSVNEAVRMDFANGIRSMMRQDPDIILVGEIRDQETAEMAFRAAMTGHQVFSTLHTNSALGAFPRLLDIGIQPDIMAGNIIGIIAQRLVRALCVHCKEAYIPTPEERKILGAGAADGRSQAPDGQVAGVGDRRVRPDERQTQERVDGRAAQQIAGKIA